MEIIETAAGPLSLLQSGSGAPIVLLHGIQGTARTWDTVAPLLAAQARVVAPNLRGRAASLTPQDPGQYRLPDYADDLLAVLEWIGQPAVLVAWSMGVSVTLELIRRHGSSHLRGLVLVSGTPCAGTEARWFQGATPAEVAQEARERGQRLGLVEAAAPHAVAASWQHVKQADQRDVLRQVAVPTLVIHGTEDDQCPIGHGRLLAGAIPGARLDEWSATGHNPMAGDPKRFALAVQGFAEGLG